MRSQRQRSNDAYRAELSAEARKEEARRAYLAERAPVLHGLIARVVAHLDGLRFTDPEFDRARDVWCVLTTEADLGSEIDQAQVDFVVAQLGLKEGN